jgi:hypothetical protein
MNCSDVLSATIAAGLLGVAFASTPACAQDSRTVEGMVINLGLVPAEVALTAAGHREAHPAHPPKGSEHLLVTLDDQKTGQRIANAEVAVEVTDSHGHVEKKPMLHTQAGGFADYSELFTFGFSGKYLIRVIVTPGPNARPVETRFVVNHMI